MKEFSIARLPEIEFGAGSLRKLAARAAAFGRQGLLVTGSGAIEVHPAWEPFLQSLTDADLQWQRLKVVGEPSPELVDEAVRSYGGTAMDVVIGLGGGSVLDAAKAVAGLLRPGNSVMDHLEGVGPERPYEGPAVPFIAAPTTAGTGSEATKNAVLSRIGPDGFKKSFRDARLVPACAIVDPDLLITCPPAQIAANGMDALTQLIESYVSLRANALTDALAVSGIEAARDALVPLYTDSGDPLAREGMAYASLLSGITLAQTGLGAVHGLASPLGALFPIPHGVVCGTLLASATEVNLRALRTRQPGSPALNKYHHVAELLCRRRFSDPDEAFSALVALLTEWNETLELETLGRFGVKQHDFDRIVTGSRGSSMRTNPVVLEDEELIGVLEARL